MQIMIPRLPFLAHPFRSLAAMPVLAAGLLLAGGLAQAHTFCVASAAQLQTALTDSSDAGMYNGEVNLIQIVKGTYKTGAVTGNLPFHYLSSAAAGVLSIQGGYDATCTTQTPKAALTILDGNHLTQVMSLHSKHAEVDVSELTIQNGESTQDGAGLSINGSAGDDSSAEATDLIIQNNHTTAFGGGIAIHAAGSGNQLFMQNNLLVGNSADLGDGAGEAVCNGSGGAAIYNNTIVKNTTPANNGTGGFTYNGGVHGYIVNNIFWNNTNYGFYVSTTNISFDYNDYGILGGVVSPGEMTGNVSTNPNFVDGAGGDYHLAGDSPLLGIGRSEPGGIDLDGHIRGIGHADLGAYEETILADGYEGN